MTAKDAPWFQPGDKVMKVDVPTPLELLAYSRDTGRTRFGVVYCVERCWLTRAGTPRVMFVGIPKIFDRYRDGVEYEVGVWTGRFRKVDEIKLCLTALNRSEASAPQPQALQP